MSIFMLFSCTARQRKRSGAEKRVSGFTTELESRAEHSRAWASQRRDRFGQISVGRVKEWGGVALWHLRAQHEDEER